MKDNSSLGSNFSSSVRQSETPREILKRLSNSFRDRTCFVLIYSYDRKQKDYTTPTKILNDPPLQFIYLFIKKVLKVTFSIVYLDERIDC